MKQNAVFWAVLFAAILLACLGYYLLGGGGEAMTASVYVDGELYDSFDLRAAVIPYEVRVETEYGYNILRISHGAIQVTEADCSEQVCVNQGAVTDGLIPIVCLPHRLVVEIEESP